MKKEYIVILFIFFIFVGPGPVVFFLNKYTVALFPILSCLAILLLLRKEIKSTDFNNTLKNSETYKWAFNGLKYCIFAHAIGAIIFGSSKILTDDLIQTYLVMSFYAIIIAPIIEEIVYRKIIFGFLDKKFNFWVAAAVSSTIFSLGHFSPERIFAYFITGMTLCYVYKKSGTLFTSVLIHAFLNYIAILVRTLKG